MPISKHRCDYERWLDTTRDLSRHTVDAYVSDVQALESFLGSNFRTRDLTAQHIYGFVDYLSAIPCSSTTIRRRISGVRGFCGWLHESDLIDQDPTLSVSLRFARPRRLPRALSESDLLRLISHLAGAADLRSSAGFPRVGSDRHVQSTTLLAVLLLVGTGMRVSELTSTTLSQIDIPARTIRVLGKGLRERMVYISNDDLSSAIEVYNAHRMQVSDLDAQLLLNRRGQPLTSSALRARLERAGDNAGISTRLTPHMLRHTAATQLIEAGVDIRFVQRLLGHASLTTTEIYTHVADRSLRHAINEADVVGGFLTRT